MGRENWCYNFGMATSTQNPLKKIFFSLVLSLILVLGTTIGRGAQLGLSIESLAKSYDSFQLIFDLACVLVVTFFFYKFNLVPILKTEGRARWWFLVTVLFVLSLLDLYYLFLTIYYHFGMTGI